MFLHLTRRCVALLCLLSVARVAATGAPPSDEQQRWLSTAHREERHGWILLHIDGSPQQRGFQHGYLLAREIAEELRVRRALWKHETSMEWAWLVEKAAAMFRPRMDEESLAELDGIAAGMGARGISTSRDELIAYNGYFELSWYWWPGELRSINDSAEPPKKQACSSFIATGSMTADGGIVLGHNTWFPYTMATANVIVAIQPSRGHAIVMQTYPGWIHSGTDFFITSAGLVGSETTIGGLSGFDPGGVPEFARFRRATQHAGSIEEWCAIMREGNNGGYANAWLLGDVRTGEIARLELGLKHVAFEKKREGYFTGSNIAEDLKVLRLETEGRDGDIRGSSVARRVRWKQLMKQHAGKIDLARAQRLLADHRDSYLGKVRPSSRTLCGHGDLDREPGGGVPFDPGGCFDAKVVNTAMARQMSFLGRWGSGCGTPFRAAEFLAKHPQFDWMDGLLKDRPRQTWTEFKAAR